MHSPLLEESIDQHALYIRRAQVPVLGLCGMFGKRYFVNPSKSPVLEEGPVSRQKYVSITQSNFLTRLESPALSLYSQTDSAEAGRWKHRKTSLIEPPDGFPLPSKESDCGTNMEQAMDSSPLLPNETSHPVLPDGTEHLEPKRSRYGRLLKPVQRL
ncbi:hypothetical protein HNY73_006132 [Argiope bruennichi]|uniref:Uncharacterized protein n=1 Tax=Argiope bruennichi TaxID=94029 RepID=A0A8T0FJX4_ARGBR|nr:hypothetical protein HNY73_006132 [Argiope bruennichi]